MNILDIIVQKADLVDYIHKITPLKRAGKTYRGVCPIHEGKNESSLSVGDKLYYCFACNSGGSIINFVADYYKIDFNAAVERLADELNIDISNDEDWRKQKDIVKRFTEIKDGAKKFLPKINDYLTQERKLDARTVENFELGYNNDLSLVIPLIDQNDRCIAIAKRNFGGVNVPKYVNSYNNYLYDKSGFLFNLNRARRRITSEVYLCEGYFDAMSADQQGLSCVAYCGDHPTVDQINLLKKYIPNPTVEIRYCPDNDAAGLKSIRKVRDSFVNSVGQISVRIVHLPEGVKDFSEAHSIGLEIKDFATEHIDMYLVKKYLAECKSAETQYAVIFEFVKTIPNAMIRGDIAKYCAKVWNKKESEIKDYFNVIDQSNEEILGEFKSVEDALKGYKELIEHGTISLGFPTIDTSINGGVRKGEVVIIGAYAGVGKTFIAGEMALHAAIRQNLNVLFFSLEMSAGALMERLASAVLGISTLDFEKKHADGDLDEIYPKIIEKLGRRIFIDDKAGLTIDEINHRIKLANTRIFDSPVDLVIIDYLQLMNGTATVEQISEAALKMKPVAKDNNCVVIGLSQLSREGDNFIRPSLKMLKGTSSLEQTGDLILMCWKLCEDPKLPLAKALEMDGVISISIEKFRRKMKARQVNVKIDEKTTRILETA